MRGLGTVTDNARCPPAVEFVAFERHLRRRHIRDLKDALSLTAGSLDARLACAAISLLLSFLHFQGLCVRARLSTTFRLVVP